MIDERGAIERAMQRFQPEPGIVDRVYDRRHRKRRAQRIEAAALGLLLAAGVVGGAVAVSRSRSVPAQPRPSIAPLPRMHNGSIDVFGILTNGVRALDVRAFPDGIGAFVVKCSGSCTEIFDAELVAGREPARVQRLVWWRLRFAGDPYHGVRIAVPASGSDRLILAGDGIGPLAWSPDGTRIVYASHGHMEARGWIWDRTLSLWSIDVDGSDQVRAEVGNHLRSGLPDMVARRYAYRVRGRRQHLRRWCRRVWIRSRSPTARTQRGRPTVARSRTWLGARSVRRRRRRTRP